ncbi:MAG: ABC transporter substrate-binding protein [Wolinella succinogenes]|uniref:ABC transporter substrate-binding protein n=1 Tax=Wolinella succinogenes TaxID=844 RepID=UPI00169A4420|nr:ABC transporter substrate-binding protein [Wolinella succinogenes]NLU34298.1 ABC transporter substrate-binding protein [Wolinella succinogenes]
MKRKNKTLLFLSFSTLFLAGVIVFLFFVLKAEKIYRYPVIKLGQSAPLSGASKHMGNSFRQGANAYFDYVNTQGGIYGRALELLTYDDKYEPKLTESNVRHLIDKEGVFALMGTIGTPTAMAAIPVALEEQIPFLMPLSGARFLREPFNRLIFNLRPSYFEEIEAISSYLTEERGFKRIAIFYQNDSFGIEGLEGLTQSLDKRGLKIVAEGIYPRNTLSVSDAVYAIHPKSPEAIVMVGTYEASALFIQRYKELNPASPPLFVNISFVAATALAEALQGNMRQVLVSNITPSPWDISNPLVREYHRLYVESMGHPPCFLSFEGFLSAKIIVEALHKTGPILSHKRFIKAMENLSPDFLSDLKLRFSATNHQAFEQVFITGYENGRFVTLKSYP